MAAAPPASSPSPSPSSSSPSHKTASTHRSAYIQATHQFDIVGYSIRKTLGVDNSVRSANFEAGGFIWALVCTFNEDKPPRDPLRVSLELTTNQTDEPLVAVATLRIDDPTGTAPSLVWRSEEPRTFPAWSTGPERWDLLPFPDAFRLHEARYVGDHDDCLTIHCTVGVLQEDSAAGPGASRNCFVSLVPPPTISKDIYRLLIERTRPDITFVVEDGSKIQAHKLVLAMRSPVFCAEFTGEMKEGTCDVIAIDDMNAATFRAMLYFIYTDDQPKPKKEACTVDMARDLLVAADLYDLGRLRLMCENTLSESLTVGNVLSTLTLVHGRSSCRHLEDSCIDYIASRPYVYDAVKATEEYMELKKTYASFIIDVADKVAARALAALGTPVASSSSSSSSSGDRDGGGFPAGPQKSASRYDPSSSVVVVASGTHEFRMDNFVAMHKLRHHAVRQTIQSGTFMAGGHKWMLVVYPANGEDGEQVSVYLAIVNLTDPAAKVKASVTLKIVDPRPRGDLPAITRRFDHVYTDKKLSIGYKEFTTVAAARSGYMAHDGSLTVRCQVAVTTEEAESSSSSCTGTVVGGAAIDVPPSNMAWHLEQLLESGKGSDVQFLAEDESETIRAHGLVIAVRSPVLHEAVVRRMDDDEEDGDDGAVKVDGVRASVLRAVLYFIYTDELTRRMPDPAAGGDATAVGGEMLGAAKRFGLERMKRMCENWLAEKLTPANAVATLEAARRHRCRELEKYCVEYIAQPHVVTEVFNLKLTVGV